MSATLPMELTDRERSLALAMFFTNKDALNYDKDEFAAMAGFKNAESARVTIRSFKKKLTEYFTAKASGDGAATTLPSTPKTGATKRKAPASTGSKAKKAVKTETPSKTDVKFENEEEDEDAATGALEDA